jgi:hypothetical protein
VATLAQSNEPLPILKADETETTRLGQAFSDSRISIKVPNGIRKVNQASPPEYADAGIYTYAWTPSGDLPSLKSLSVTLLPPTKPSSETLDDFIDGLKTSMRKGFESVEFGEIQLGNFNGNEVRHGEFTAQASGESVVAYYLVGIDKLGTFSLTAMLPRAEATHEEIKAFRTSLLTFSRVQ